MKNSKLLIISQYASTPKYSSGAGERFFYLLPYFKEAGFKADIVSGSYNHLLIDYPRTPKLFNNEEIPGGKMTWVRLRRYKGSISLGRIFSWLEFFTKLFFLKIKEPPKIVIVSSMSLFPILFGYYLKCKYSTKLILEVRDIWPLTLIELGGYSRKNPFIQLMLWLENFAYRKADCLVSVLPDFQKYIDKILPITKKVIWIPNAIHYGKNTDGEYDNDYLNLENFNVVYTGALGNANAMEYVVDAAFLIDDYQKIKISIIGNGPEKENLIQRAKDLKNIEFFPKIHKSLVLDILDNADVCTISWRKKNIYKYGVSANKYNDYMLSCKPVISASSIANDPIKLSGCGIQVKAENSREIADAIIKLYLMSIEKRQKMGEKGKEFVMKNNTYSLIANKYIKLLQNCER